MRAVYDLSVDRLNREWATMEVGKPVTIRDPMMEEGRIVLKKATKRLLKVKVYVF